MTVEGVLEVVGVGRLEGDVLTGLRVLEAELHRVQPLPLDPDAPRQGGVGTVGEVADARVLQRRHVDADLVGAPGLEVDLEQRGEPMRLERLVVGHRLTPVRADRELVVVLRVAPDRCVDRPLERVGVALDQRVVGLVDRTLPERVLEDGVGVLGLGDHHHARGADVEALDDALALLGPRGGDPEAGRDEVADDGLPLPARRGMDGHADRLVDHHEGVVVVDDLDALDDLGLDLEGVCLRRDRRVEHRPGTDPVALGHGRAVHGHQPFGDQLCRTGAGEAEQPRHGGVDPLPLQTVGDVQRALVGVTEVHFFSPSGSSEVSSDSSAAPPSIDPSSPIPLNEKITISTAATLMHMSATLKIGQLGSCRKSTTCPT